MSTEATVAKSGRIVELDALRGFLAVWVFTAHAVNFSRFFELNRWVPALGQPAEAVSVFIMLSGFVILLTLEQTPSWQAFVIRRFFRLYPLFVGCFAVMVILQLSLQRGLYPHSYQLSVDHFWTHLASHLVMMHGVLPDIWVPESSTAFLPPAWSISLEWQFYLAAPALLAWFHRGWWPGLVLALALVAARVLSTVRVLPAFDMNAFLPLRIEMFALGAASYLAMKRWVQRPAGALLTTAIFPWAAIVTFLVTKRIAVTLWVTVVVLMLENRAGSQAWLTARVTAWCRHPFGRRLGDLSYAIYLCHWPVLVGLEALVSPHVTGTTARFACYFFGGGVLTFLAAEGLHRAVELPGIAWGRRLATAVAERRTAARG